MNIRFHKMHCHGNHIMAADMRDWCVRTEWARAMGDPRTGVGFDQLMAIEHSRHPDADFDFRAFNSGGGEIEQCGNGLRCLARFAFEEGMTDKRTLIWSSVFGKLYKTELLDDGNVKADLGVPKINKEFISGVRVPGRRKPAAFVRLSLGNPHMVVFADFAKDLDDLDVDDLGPALLDSLQPHAFPNGANVGFLHRRKDPEPWRLRVCERDVGETPSCGSAAAAALVAAKRTANSSGEAVIRMPGGALKVGWGGPGHPATVEGPATTVYKAEMDC